MAETPIYSCTCGSGDQCPIHTWTMPAEPAAPRAPGIDWLVKYHGITVGHLETPAWKHQIENERHLIAAYLEAREPAPDPTAALRALVNRLAVALQTLLSFDDVRYATDEGPTDMGWKSAALTAAVAEADAALLATRGTA